MCVILLFSQHKPNYNIIIIMKSENSTALPISAIAVFQGKVSGCVRLVEDIENKCVIIDVDLRGLKRNFSHGFHIHEYGDMSEGCTTMCNHFNPFGKKHGSPDDSNRHLGDLGNIQTDSAGNAKYQFADSMIKLRGTKSNIIGRGLVIHADTDDLGRGGNEESLKTGNAGKRIACSVIGFARPTL